MRQHYKDILDRIAEAPTWFDDFGVPRFGQFSPQRLSNIYASEAALAEVSCQECKRVFRVALTEAFACKPFSLSDEIRLGRVDYGDPPNIDCCIAGSCMGSVMHKILEYWSNDLEVSRDWRRDPTFEGPVADTRDPPDTVAEVLAAVASGATAILVMCTSRANRYDLAGRITAALASDGRVLVAYPESYDVVARKMLEGRAPAACVGYWKEERDVTLADFSRLKNVRLGTMRSVVILAAAHPLSEVARTVWTEAATRLTAKASDKIKIELTLAHSCSMFANPHIIVDAGQSTLATGAN
jgi:hypothetical protein